ncbi:hypothetical protein FE782_00375 [Paenibacillus antri]|uniref:Fibronectin type-III domain-containing protein n=1 Tax=Paenibacillus antri TaxID=2582848 RepID=A0A5R9GDL8_9BACL|nr:hypothetical protein FE782_00375 [Paenibacillus antri]
MRGSNLAATEDGGSADDLQLVQVEAGTNMESLLAELNKDPRVAYAEPNYRLTSQSMFEKLTPTDGKYGEQWAFDWDQLAPAAAWETGLWRLFQEAANGEDNEYDLNGNGYLDEADDIPGLVASEAAEVIVAVVDTGVAAAHEDLDGKVLPGYNAITDSEASGAAQDDSANGHGTHVAGIIAANVSNEWGDEEPQGIAGVTGNFPIKILPVKALDAAGIGTVYHIARGIEWAADHGAKVINLSLGARLPDFPQTLANAIQYALDRGAVVIAAAGNGSGYVQDFYPASLPGVVSVAASDPAHHPASFSNRGATITAPGVNIWSTLPGNRYGELSGTSQAAAYASGTAALYRSVHPDVSVEKVSYALDVGEKDYPENCTSYWWGTVCENHYYVLNMAQTLNSDSEPWTNIEILEPVPPESGGDLLVRGQVNTVVRVQNIAETQKVVFSLSAYDSDEGVPILLGEVEREEIPESGVIAFQWDSAQYKDGRYTLLVDLYYSEENYTYDYLELNIANGTFGGFEIEVDKPDGTAAAGARITVSHRVEEVDSETGESYSWYERIWVGQADTEGKAVISGTDAISGNDFLVTARGSDPAFFYYRTARAPGNVHFTGADAQRMSISGLQTDREPLAGALILFELLDEGAGEPVPYDDNVSDIPMTVLNAEGESELYLSRGTYDIRLVDADSYYFLVHKNIDITNDTHTVAFHPEADEVSTVGIMSGDFAAASFLLKDGNGAFIGIQGVPEAMKATVTPGEYIAQIDAIVPDEGANKEYVWTLVTPKLQLQPGEERHVVYGSPLGGTIQNSPIFHEDGVREQGESAYFNIYFLDPYKNYTSGLASQPLGSHEASGVSAAGGSILVRPQPKPSEPADTYVYRPASLQFEAWNQNAVSVRPTFIVQDAEGNAVPGSRSISLSASTDYANAYWDIPFNLPVGTYYAKASLASGPLSAEDTGITETPPFAVEVKAAEQEPFDPDISIQVLDRAGNPMVGARVRLVVHAGDSFDFMPEAYGDTDIRGVAAFQDLYWDPEGTFGALITGTSPNPDGPSGEQEAIVWFEPFAYEGTPVSLVASAEDLDWNRVVLKPIDHLGEEFSELSAMSFTVVGHDGIGAAYDWSFVGDSDDSLPDALTLWLPNGEYTFQAYSQQHRFQTEYSPDPEDLYFLTKRVRLPSELPADGTILLGGEDLARLAFASPASSQRTPEYVVPSAALYPEGVPYAPILYPQYVGSVYDEDEGESSSKVVNRELYVTPGTYTAQAALVHHRFDGDWDYWLERSIALSPKQTWTWDMDDAFSSMIATDKESYGQAGTVTFHHDIRDSRDNRLVAAAIGLNLENGGYTPSSMPVQSGGATAQNHDELAPFVTLYDPEGTEIDHFKEAGWNDEVIKQMWTNGDFGFGNTRAPLLKGGSTYFGAEYTLPMQLPSGAYRAKLTFQGGPHSFAPAETFFSVDVGIEAPHLDPLPAFTNAGQIEISGTAQPGSQIAIRYRIGGGAAVEAGTAAADAATGRFSATLALPQEGAYAITARATANGMTSVEAAPRTLTVDRTPPGAPLQFAGVSETPTSVQLSWLVPSNESAVRYEVKRDGVVLVTALTGESYGDQGLTADTEYAYEVTAVDQAGNRSPSAAVTVRTLASILLEIASFRWQGVKDANGLLVREADLKFILTGNPGVQASAVVAYRTEGGDGEPVATSVELTEDKDSQGRGLGIYRGAYTLPEGVIELVSITGVLANGTSRNDSQAATGLPLPLSGELAVTIVVDPVDEPNSGVLNGGSVTAWSPSKRSGGRAATAGKGTYVLPMLAPADDYVVRILSHTGAVLLEQTGVLVSSGVTSDISLKPNLPVPLYVRVLDDSANPVEGAGVVLNGGIAVGISGGDGWARTYRNAGAPAPASMYDQLISGAEVTLKVDADERYFPVEPVRTLLTPDNDTVVITVPKRPVAALQGSIATNERQGLAGAAITVYQKLDGKEIVRFTQSDSNGNYAIQLFAGAETRLFVSHRNTGSKNFELDTPLGNGENRTFDMELFAQKAISLKVYTQKIGHPAFEMDMDWRVAVHLRLNIRNTGRVGKSKNTSISYSNNAFSKIAIPDGEPGDRIIITADGYEAGLGTASVEVVLNNDSWASAEIRLTEEGRVDALVRDELAQAQEGKERWVDVFRSGPEGKSWVKAASSKSEALSTGNLDDGTYTLVYHWDYQWMRDYNALLQRLGANAVVRDNVVVRNGEVIELASISLPSPDSTAAGYFRGREGNELTASKYETGPGQTVTLRAGYKYAGNQALGDLVFLLGIPEGASLVANSVAVNAVQGPGDPIVSERSGQVEVRLGETPAGPVEGSIVYKVRIGDHADWPTAAAEAWAEFKAAGVPKREKLGHVVLQVPYVTIAAPSTVWTRQVPVNGRAPAGADVQIYDSSDLLAETTASSTGLWQTTVTLPDRGSSAHHALRAQTPSGDVGDPAISPAAFVVYDPDRPRITSVTMKQQDGRQITFAPGSKFPYVYVPSYAFNFNVSFNDSSRVSNLTIYAENGAKAGGGNAPPTGTITSVLASSGSSYSSTPGRIYASYDVAPKAWSSAAVMPIDPGKVRASMPDPWRDASVRKVDYNDGDPNTTETSTELLIGGNPHLRLNTSIVVRNIVYTPTDEEAAAVVNGGPPVYGFEINHRIVGNDLEYEIKAIIPDSELNPGQIGAQGIETPAKLAWIFGKTAVDGGLALSDLYSTINGALGYSEYADKVDKALAGCSGDSIVYPAYRDYANYLKDAARRDFVVSNLVQLSFTGIGAFAGFGVGGAIGLAVANMVLATAVDMQKDKRLNDFINDIKNDAECEKKDDDDNDRKKELIADPTWIIDPSGYVYEAVPDNRLEGVTTTILQKVGDDWTVWDAAWFEQENPLTTDSQGRYGWDVPVGLWKVLYEEEGYVAAFSDELPVPPPQLDVNVGLVSLAPPQVSNVKATEKGIDITFDKYMTVTTLGASTVKVYIPDEVDEFGFPAEAAGSVVPVVPQADPSREGVQLARTFRFTPSSPLTIGGRYRVWVGQLAQSYAERPMETDFDQTVQAVSSVVEEVTNVQVVSGDRRLTLTWNDPQSANASKLRIAWRKQGTVEYGEPVEIGIGIGTYTLMNLDNDAVYEARIIVVDVSGEASSGVVVTGTPKKPSQPPGGGWGPVPTVPALPANEQTVTVAAGAQTHSFFNGEVSLVLPEGALPTGTKLLIRKVQETAPLPAGFSSLSDSYEISSEGEAPAQPIELRIKLASDRMIPDFRKLGIYRHEGGKWHYNSSISHLSTRTVTANVRKWGKYAVLSYSRSFDDLFGHWSKDAVEVLASRHIVDGVNERKFVPNQFVTRAEIAKLWAETLESVAGNELPQVEKKQIFMDVPPNAWYFPYVQAAASYGLVQGSAGKFRPNDPVTREELAVLISRLLERLKVTLNEDTELPFKDASGISSWALQAVKQVYGEGAMIGVSPSEFAPKAKTTRGEAAMALFRILDKLDMITGE